ncbi:MAG: hypothetical protein ACI39C_07430 [Dietzia sp.]
MATKKQTDHLVVTAAMVSARRADGSLVYLYRGTPLPNGLAEGEADRLADLGMVGEHAVPVVAEAPRPTARVNGRGRAPAAAPAGAAPKKAPAKSSSSKSSAEKAAEKAAAEKAAAEAAAAAKTADGVGDGGEGDGGTTADGDGDTGGADSSKD